MREVKCLSSAVASVRPGRTGSQLCLERPRKTKGAEAWVLGLGRREGCLGDAESKQQESCQARRRSPHTRSCAGLNFKRRHCDRH